MWAGLLDDELASGLVLAGDAPNWRFSGIRSVPREGSTKALTGLFSINFKWRLLSVHANTYWYVLERNGRMGTGVGYVVNLI